MVTWPEEWTTATIGEVFNVSAGGDVDKLPFSKVPTPIYKYEVFSNGVENRGLYGYSSKALYPANSLTVSARGTIGRTFYRDKDFNAIIRLLVLTPKSKNVDARFYSYYIDSQVVFVRENTGVAQLTVPRIKEIIIPIPLLEEQHAIADTLSAFDRHISALSALIAKKQAVRQGALEDLMTGRTRLDSFCDSWKTVKLGELCEITSSKRVFESEWQQSGIPFLRTRDIASFHAGEEQKDKLFISEATYRAKVAVSGELRKGDLLVTGVGTIGLPFIVDTDAKMYFKDGNILWVKRSNKIDTKFLYYLFLSKDIRTQINTFSGFTTVGTLTIQNAKKLQVNLPTLDEQLAISSVLSALDSELSALNSERAKFSAIRQAAISDLLTGKTRLERTAH